MAVTSTNNLRKGSKGSDVTELQRLLNSTGYGYNLAEDGSYGSNTEAAVRDYQKRMGLTEDGIVGTNTWGKLNQASSASTPAATAPAEVKAPTFEYQTYKPSDTVAQAETLLQQHLAHKPGEYTSAWQSQLNDIIQKIQNREKFTYDLNGDALYQQYKDQYTTQGKLASMDAMGQVAALTGGYGNSYAQTVGQQAYQGYLQQLNAKVPELYQLALNQYNQERDALYDQASLMAGMEEQEYGRYRDNMSDYYTELDRLTNDARYQAEQDYSKWANDQSFGYQQYRDQVGDEQWQAQFDEAKRQYDEQMALSERKISNPGNPGGSYTANPGWDEETIKAFQEAHHLEVDGKWGPKTAAAYDEDPDWQPSGGVINFTGTTYSEAIAFAKSHGVEGSYTNAILSQSDFSRKKASSSPSEAKEFDTYQEYLQYVVETMIDAYGK